MPLKFSMWRKNKVIKSLILIKKCFLIQKFGDRTPKKEFERLIRKYFV